MRLLPIVAAVAFVSTSLVARADSFTFSFGNSSSSFGGSGMLTTGQLLAPGEYPVIRVTGTAETTAGGPPLAIKSILAPGVFPTPANGGSFPANDNILFVNNGVGTLSQDGLSFVLSNGAQVNLFNDGPGIDGMLERANGNVVYEAVPIVIGTVAPTPEPSSMALLGTGLLAVAGVVRRRFA